jgi:4-amino-4-deoxy-L-arabinose transferase-like glycosyltransferase
MTEALFIFLLTSSVLLLIQAKKYSSSILYGLSGLGWGLAVLCRSIIWGFIPILIIYLFFILLKQRANFMKSFFVFIIGILLIIIPWSIRNYRVSAGIFSPAIGGWCMLYMGNNPLATGGGGGWLVLNEDMRVEDDIKEKINIVSISELENIFIKRALKFMLNNPKRTAVLAVKKFINMWRPYYPSARMSTKVILLLTDLMFIFPLGIIGMVLCRNKKWPPLFYLLIGYYFLIHLFLVAEIRHRLPIMPFLIIFSAYVLNKTLQRCCAGKSQSLS